MIWLTRVFLGGILSFLYLCLVVLGILGIAALIYSLT